MQKLKLYQIDAFTDKVFGGNPAAVCVLDNLTCELAGDRVKITGKAVTYLTGEIEV